MVTIRTKKYYDTIAKGYDELYRKEQLEKFEKVPKLEGKILDIGAGTGLLNEFVDVGVSADLSTGILKFNKNKMKICCSVTHLPFKTNSFDYVVSITVMQDLSKAAMEKSLIEIKRVASKKAVVSIMAASVKTGFFQNLLTNKYNAEIVESGRDLMATFGK